MPLILTLITEACSHYRQEMSWERLGDLLKRENARLPKDC